RTFLVTFSPAHALYGRGTTQTHRHNLLFTSLCFCFSVVVARLRGPGGPRGRAFEDFSPWGKAAFTGFSALGKCPRILLDFSALGGVPGFTAYIRIASAGFERLPLPIQDASLRNNLPPRHPGEISAYFSMD